MLHNFLDLLYKQSHDVSDAWMVPLDPMKEGGPHVITAILQETSLLLLMMSCLVMCGYAVGMQWTEQHAVHSAICEWMYCSMLIIKSVHLCLGI